MAGASKFATWSGTVSSCIGEVERAEKKTTLETLEKIAKVLGVRIGDLLGEK